MRNQLVATFIVLTFGCGDNNRAKVDIDAAIIDTPPCVPTNIRGTVTSGDVSLDATQTSVLVEMTPPLERSVLFFSLREFEPSPVFGNVRCELVPEDTVAMTPAGLVCQRDFPGTESNPPTPITVRWQVVTFNEGVNIQRGVAFTSPTNPRDVPLAPPVDPAKSFVILGGAIASGTGWGSNDFTRAVLKSGTTLEVGQAAVGARLSWQVVELADASVQRGTTSLSMTETTKSVTVSGLTSSSVLLASHTTDNPSGIEAAAMMLQGTITNPTTVEFKRDAPGSGMTVEYEIVNLPFKTQQFTTNFAAGETSKTQAVTGFAPATSVVFSTMHAVLGQSTGSTAFADPATLDLPGEAAATLTLAAGSVSLERATGSAAASITWNAVDFGDDNLCN